MAAQASRGAASEGKAILKLSGLGGLRLDEKLDRHWLAGMLLLGSVTGAQLGTQFAQKVSPVQLRLALAVIVLLIALRLALGLGYRPDEIYTVAPL